MADVSAERVHDRIVTREMLTRDAALLTDAVREAGALALSLFRTELKNWTKGASSPVSEADIRVNGPLESRLRSATPDYGWLSEEASTTMRLGKRLTWIVDPIDGTRGYLAGREDWCVSVALVEDATPVLAAVFVPVSDEFFLAVRGQGATLNGVSVAAATGTELRIFPASPVRSRWSNGSTGRPGRLCCTPEFGSLALRLCRVAQGSLDAAFAGGQSRDWDLAAANLIVQEANGNMTALSGDAILYNRREVTHGVLVAAGRDRHARIVEHFRNHPLP